MDIYALGSEFNPMRLIDNYKSCIWTERYDKFGDFELLLPLGSKYENTLRTTPYLRIPGSDEIMVVESFSETDSLKVAGRSLSSILDRRRIWRNQPAPEPNVNVTLHHMIVDMVRVNMGQWADGDRRVSNLETLFEKPPGFVDRADFGEIKYGDSLYDTVVTLCTSANLGFTITVKPRPDPLSTSWMQFKTRFGVDRSSGLNGRVVFSEAVGNVESMTTLESKETMRNVAMLNIPPESENGGPGSVWQLAPWGLNNEYTTPTGIDRREIWLDISSYKDDPTFNDPSRQPAVLEAIARQELLKTPFIDSVDFKLSNKNKYRYGEHYNLGDIVEVTKPSGAGAKYRVTEYIRHADQQGSSEYPTLTAV